jgi:hypothetical protein
MKLTRSWNSRRLLERGWMSLNRQLRRVKKIEFPEQGSSKF